MPCYDPPMWEDEFGNYHAGERPKAWCDKMVRMLCEANRLIDDRDCSYGPTHTTRSKELADWWKEHQEWDARRRTKSEAEARQEARLRRGR
jgi:hypothetical protein